MKIIELIEQYHQFIEKLAPVFGLDFYKDDYYLYIDDYESADPVELAHFLKRQNLETLPDDIIVFWHHFKKTISGTKYHHEDKRYFYVGFDFYNIRNMERDLPDFREIATIYADTNKDSTDGDYWWEYYMHKNGVPLSFEEPSLALFVETGEIMFMIYDGGAPEFSIADSFTEFFEHYLASGCFRGGNFEAFWDEVKDIVPIHIPIEENKWINFYKKVYQV